MWKRETQLAFPGKEKLELLSPIGRFLTAVLLCWPTNLKSFRADDPAV